MTYPKRCAAAITLILAAAAGYLTGGAHGALLGLLISGAAICWRYS